ncbi:MAG TPA: hypothetical protein VGK48_19575 [Terriglobia bacterium]
MPSEVLELTQDAFTELYSRYPQVLINLVRILSQRLTRTNSRTGERHHWGETIALVLCPPQRLAAEALFAETRDASPGAVTALDLTGVLAGGAPVCNNTRAWKRCWPRLTSYASIMRRSWCSPVPNKRT